MTWLMIPVALALVGVAKIAIMLFPENNAEPKHYEGDFGDSGDTVLRSWDEMSTQEKDNLWDI